MFVTTAPECVVFCSCFFMCYTCKLQELKAVCDCGREARITSDERDVHTLSLQRDKEKKKPRPSQKSPILPRSKTRVANVYGPFPGSPHDERHKHIDHLFHDAFETALERTLMVRPDAERSRLSASRRGRKIQEWPCSARGMNCETSKFPP